MKVASTLKGFQKMLSGTRIFNPQEVFRDKRIAVIGAADSAFEKENGEIIDSYDLVIRINKAPLKLTKEKMNFVGSKTDVLLHSFYENSESGGGPIDWDVYNNQGVKYLINPNNNLAGWKTHLNYFKRAFQKQKTGSQFLTYFLPRRFYKNMVVNFGKWTPTIGYSALYSVLNSPCEEIYITGFTFFKTPYSADYRDQLLDLEVNKEFIKDQNIHNPDLELKEFVTELEKHKYKRIILDPSLCSIVENYK